MTFRPTGKAQILYNGATTFSITTLTIKRLSITTLSITINNVTSSVTTLSIINRNILLSVVYAECHVFDILMLSVINLSVDIF